MVVVLKNKTRGYAFERNKRNSVTDSLSLSLLLVQVLNNKRVKRERRRLPVCYAFCYAKKEA